MTEEKKSKSRLIELPNGSWVMPEAVCSVSVVQQGSSIAPDWMVIVTHGVRGREEIIKTYSEEHARIVAAQIAEEINNRAEDLTLKDLIQKNQDDAQDHPTMQWGAQARPTMQWGGC